MGLLSFLFGKAKSKKEYESREIVPAGHGRALSRAPAKKLSVINILVGDVISYNLNDYVVRNRYVYEDHGFRWYSYHLVDTISGDKFWLDAEDDDELEVAVVRPIQLELGPQIPKTLFFEGLKYYLDEHGHANVTIESEMSDPKFAKVEFWDFYDQAEKTGLGIERWGNDYEYSLSQFIEPYEITILGGAGEDA